MQTNAPATEEQKQKRRRQIIGWSVLIPLLILLAVLSWIGWRFMQQFEGGTTAERVQAFSDFLSQFGWYGRVVMVLIEVIQIVIAVIPGGITETAAGFVFGPVEGTLLSLIGIFTAYTLVFFLVKRFGIRLVALFMDPKKIDELKFINSEERLTRTVFILYFIPGLPKDLFTYFFSLTRIKWKTFIIIVMLARTPTLISTVCGGMLIADGKLWEAVALFMVIAALSIAGACWYSHYLKRHQTKDPIEPTEING